jgi:hypothetical protein
LQREVKQFPQHQDQVHGVRNKDTLHSGATKDW